MAIPCRWLSSIPITGEGIMRSRVTSQFCMTSIIGLFAISVMGCQSFDRKLDSWVGAPIERFLSVPDQLPPEAIRGPDEQGHRTYVTRIGRKDCMVYWNVDGAGIIRGWRHEGSSCKYYTY